MFIRKALTRRVGLALGFCALAALPASAEYDNGYGYLRAVEGSATLMQAGSGTRTPAELNQPVLPGDRLLVPARSRVEIVLADRNLLRIDGGSEVVLERLAASPDSQDRGTVLRLIEGNVLLTVLRESLGDELPRIDTPNATIYVQDYGVFRVSADQEASTELIVRNGRAEVRSDRDTESVQADEQAFVDGDSRIEVESAGSYDSLEHWADRLDEDGRVDDRSSEYLDEDIRYAAAPLSRNGSWIDYQGSHYWRPRVAASWRPYQNGRWAYTPSGYNWVSYDPWGYVPHHYGSWDYIPAYGWVWLPGRVYSPAWVYWYWGPSYTGWCPVGYYTRYYGSRWGGGFGFHVGVYGWAGGDWGLFGNWTFISSSYWHGYRDGFRDGRFDGWHDRWNVQRHAVPFDQLRRHGPLDRGLVTTDTRPLNPDVLRDPRHAVEVLSRDPSARRIASRANGELPNVNDFIARRELPATLRRTVADGDASHLDGTPMRPDTLGRRGRGDREASARGARALPGTPADRDPGRPRVVIGDRDEGARPGSRSGSESTSRSPRDGRPTAGESGGMARPDRGNRAEPRERDSGEGVRPDRGVRALPRDRSDSDRGESGRSGATPQGYRRIDPGSERPSDPSGSRGRSSQGYTRPEARDSQPNARRPSDRQTYERPEPRTSRPEPRSYERPEPRSYGRPEPRSSERPEPRSYERPRPEPRSSEPSSRDRYERPEPRSYEPRVYERSAPPSSNREGTERPSSPRVYERSSPPSSSRGGYESPSRPEPRAEPRSAPRSYGGSEGRSGGRGSSSEGRSAEGRSSSRGGSRGHGRE
ncbi:MAG TPA: DUF6600 domain-containing protein [Thermoanaerobaculia bacterium]|nr:DUF6600 domain-containing protein [Thermoanaerobaculia bacterium]